MATLALGIAGAAAGAAATQAGYGIVAAALISSAFAAAGAVIDASIIRSQIERGREKEKIQDSGFDNGAGCPTGIGYIRTQAQVIWVSDPNIAEDDSGKAFRTPKRTTIKRDIAIAFHRGPISSNAFVECFFANSTKIKNLSTTVPYSITNHTFVSVTGDFVWNGSEVKYFLQLELDFATVSDADIARTMFEVNPFFYFESTDISNALFLWLPHGENVDDQDNAYGHKISITTGSGPDKLYLNFMAINEDQINNPKFGLTLSDFAPGGISAPIYFKTIDPSEAYYKELIIYDGSMDQPIDPTIAAAMEVGKVPAYRGTAYAVFKQFDCTSWGGVIPQFEVLFYTQAGNPSLYEAISNVLGQGNHWDVLRALKFIDDPPNIEFGGVVWAGPTPTIEKLKVLLQLGGLVMREGFIVSSNGMTYSPTIEIAEKRNTYERVIDVEDVSCRAFGEGGTRSLVLTRNNSNEAPNSVTFSYLNSERDNRTYTIAHQTIPSNSIPFFSKNELSLNFPLAMTREQAQNFAIRLFWDAQTNKDSLSLSLPTQYADLLPGDQIEVVVEGVVLKSIVSEIDFGANGLVLVKSILDDAESFDQKTDPEEDELVPVTPPQLIVIEIPPVQVADINKLVLYATIASTSTTLGGKFSVNWSEDRVVWNGMGIVANPRFMSRTTSNISNGVAEVYDRSFIGVENQSLMENYTNEMAASGGARFYLGSGEIMGFGDETLDSVAASAVTNLVRGWNRSDVVDYIDPAVVVHFPEDLTGWIRLELPIIYVGKSISFTAGPFPSVGSIPFKYTKIIQGTSLKNPLPYGISSHRISTVGLYVFFYICHPRPTDILSSGHVTYAEAISSYVPFVEILDAGSNVIRVINAQFTGTAKWRVSYLASDQTIDFGSEPTNISFRIKVPSTINKILSITHTSTNNYLEHAF